jgi:hypothetical protein
MYANGGRFKGRVTKWGLTPSSSKGTEQFYVTALLVCQIQDGEEVHCPGGEVTVFRAITDNTIDYVVEDLKNLGFTGTDWSALLPDAPNAHSFEGVEVPLRCKHEEYKGKTQERWEFGFRDGTLKELDSTGVSKLNSRFGAKLKQAFSKGPHKPAPAASQGPLTPPGKSTAEQLEEVL